MKYYLHTAKITGLWGSEASIGLNFDRSFNFLIGRNGTGKTTVINLLAAVLLGNFDQLDKIAFSKVVVALRAAEGRGRATISVSKVQVENSPAFEISYEIKSTGQEHSFAFTVENIDRDRIRPMHRERMYRQHIFAREALEAVVKVSWLSVHRHSDAYDRSQEDRRYASGIDQKLTALLTELVKYFSQLGTEFSAETLQFQKNSFLALITGSRFDDMSKSLKNINIEEERLALSSILELLGVERKRYSKQLDEIVTRFSESSGEFQAGKPILVDQLFAISDVIKIHALKELYEELQAKRKQVYNPLENFIDVINSLFKPWKIASISAQNELVVSKNSGGRIDVEDLSSGEKQLLIILVQAILQKSEPVVYIADEPELSLHVEWQERLTSAIARLNPHAQIVFATHSPDIVGSHSENIIDMERFL